MRNLALLGILSLALAACGSSTGVTTNTDGSMHVQTSEGSFDAGSGTMPADWPADVATYAGATVKYSASTNAATGGAGAMVMLETSDAKDLVTKFYTDQLKADGWTIATTMQSGDMTIMAATKDDRSLSAQIATADGKTSVTLAVGKK